MKATGKTPIIKGPDLTHVKELVQIAKGQAQKSNRKYNLELLWSVLESIRDDGSRDFSIAEVGRRMESAGGMRTQSLRNEGAQDFRRIIAEYAEAVRIKGEPIQAAGGDAAKRALGEVADPLAKAVLEGYVREARRLREENNMLREAIRKTQIPATLPEAARSPILSNVVRMESELLQILKKSFSHKEIKKWGIIREDGSILDIEGCLLFPRRFTEAIDAAIAILTK